MYSQYFTETAVRKLTVRPRNGDALKEDKHEQTHSRRGVRVEQLEHVHSTLQQRTTDSVPAPQHRQEWNNLGKCHRKAKNTSSDFQKLEVACD